MRQRNIWKFSLMLLVYVTFATLKTRNHHFVFPFFASFFFFSWANVFHFHIIFLLCLSVCVLLFFLFFWLHVHFSIIIIVDPIWLMMIIKYSFPCLLLLLFLFSFCLWHFCTITICGKCCQLFLCIRRHLNQNPSWLPIIGIIFKFIYRIDNQQSG